MAGPAALFADGFYRRYLTHLRAELFLADRVPPPIVDPDGAGRAEGDPAEE
jgi:hypothetical protein